MIRPGEQFNERQSTYVGGGDWFGREVCTGIAITNSQIVGSKNGEWRTQVMKEGGHDVLVGVWGLRTFFAEQGMRGQGKQLTSGDTLFKYNSTSDIGGGITALAEEGGRLVREEGR